MARRPKAKKDEPTPDTPDDEAVATDPEGEDEGQPKRRGRAAAPLVVTAHGVEIVEALESDDAPEVEEGDPATGELVKQLRDADMKWDSPEGESLKDVFGSKSAIPLRKLLQMLDADNGGKIDIEDTDAVVKAVDEEGKGFGQVAALSGSSITAVREAYVEGEGRFAEEVAESGGRVYGKGDAARWHPGAAKGEVFEKPVKAASDDSDDEDESPDEEPDEDAAPKRRRRQKSNA